MNVALTAEVVDRLDAHNPSDHHGCYCNSPRSGWIVATTNPQAEPWAETNLSQRGYQTYLPRHAVRRRDRTITRIVIIPLWPGYIFVHHDTRDSWRPIYETPGVRSVLRNRDQIQFAPEAAVSALQATEPLRRSLTAETTQWAPGALVAVAKGAFVGHHAVVLEVEPKSIAVAIMAFGHLRRVTVSVDCLVGRDW